MVPNQDLPAEQIVPALREALTEHPEVLLQAPPGAGKSTLLPLRLVNEPWLGNQKILMLEPRRLAARAVAARMAQLMGEPLGQTIGYRVRFESRVSRETRIEVITEGILTRILQDDNALEGVGIVIFDEFHERSLQADLALVLTRQVREILRPELRTLIMSATLDIGNLSPGAPFVRSVGRQYPVDIRYLDLPHTDRPAANVARTVKQALREESGDILAFLPGTGDIRRTEALLEETGLSAAITPLYGDLPPAAQDAALRPDPSGRRKVVLATSIAETSLTIEGIRIVIDSGCSRVPLFDPRSGLTRLETVDVTLDAADQRAGRAGRTAPGICYRLWSEARHRQLQPHRKPEILTADLSQLVLDLALWGVTDPAECAWPTPPPPGAWSQALELLEALGAISDGRITERGKEMLRMPTHPRIAHLLVEARALGMEPLAADLSAVLEERDPLSREAGADVALRVDALRKMRAGERTHGERSLLRRIEKLAAAWRRILRCEADNRPADHLHCGRLLAAAYPERVARKAEGAELRYRLANGRQGSIEEFDPLAGEDWLAVAHIHPGQKQGRIFIAAALDPSDLESEAQEFRRVEWDDKQQCLIAAVERRVVGHLLSSRPLTDLDEEEVLPVILRAIRADPDLLSWSEAVASWQARVGSLRAWRSEEPWPDVSREALLDRLEEWLGPYLGKVRKATDLAKTDMLGLLSGMLPWPLGQELEKLAPTHFEVPTGSRIRLAYFADGSPPVLAVRIQEMFGLHTHPSVNDGRQPLLLHLLSPAYRPAQITSDLVSFWKNSYLDVRKDLRGRYPKHYWPEDPWSAVAVRGVKRKKP